MQMVILRGSKQKLPRKKQGTKIIRAKMTKTTKDHLQLAAKLLRNDISVKSWIGVFFGLPSIRAKRIKLLFYLLNYQW